MEIKYIKPPVIIGGQVIAPDDAKKAVPETVGGSAAEQIAIRNSLNPKPIEVVPTLDEYYAAVEARAQKLKADAIAEREKVRKRLAL